MLKHTAIWLLGVIGTIALSPQAVGDTIPQPAGWVNDFSNCISDEYRQKITELITEVELKTSSEIAVVTVASMAPYDEAGYARLLFDRWKPGKKGKDNGVLVLLAIKERAWRIETGYGMEELLPDGVCGEIGRDYMVPSFKEGLYGKGLYYGVLAIAGAIVKNSGGTLEHAERLPPKKSVDAPLFLYFFAFIFFAIWNLPWPIFIGLPFTAFFALCFYQVSPWVSLLIIAGYCVSLIIRYRYWSEQSPKRRRSFFGPQDYGGRVTSGGWGGGYSGGFGGGGGFGGFGGGGGGAGGRF